MNKLKYEYKELYDKISNNDLINAVDYIQRIAKLHYNYKWLIHFDLWGKWLALMYICKNHFAGELISKTDIAKQVIGMSRDGALKWIDCLIQQEILFKLHDPSIQKDKRKIYIIPNRHLTEEFCEYIKERLLLAYKHIDKFQIDETNIVDRINPKLISIKNYKNNKK